MAINGAATAGNFIWQEGATTIQLTDDLTEDETKAIFADSGYMSQDRKRALRAKGIFGGIIERRVRGQSDLRAK